MSKGTEVYLEKKSTYTQGGDGTTIVPRKNLASVFNLFGSFWILLVWFWLPSLNELYVIHSFTPVTVYLVQRYTNVSQKSWLRLLGSLVSPFLERYIIEAHYVAAVSELSVLVVKRLIKTSTMKYERKENPITKLQRWVTSNRKGDVVTRRRLRRCCRCCRNNEPITLNIVRGSSTFICGIDVWGESFAWVQ